jgi:hypothetical protein
VGVIQRAIYDRIFIGNALDILPQFGADSYDLVLLVDVLEHFSRAEGEKVIAECRRVGRVLIVSTPRVFWHQEDSWGNPFERHQSLWSKKDFIALGAAEVRQAENWVGIFAKPPYVERFAWRYRLWRAGNRWTPAFMRPAASLIYHKFLSEKKD